MFENPYEDEARERWGDTEAWRESQRRVKGYAPEQMTQATAEMGAATADLASLLAGNVPAQDPRATEAAERARLSIDRWFYPCSHEMHVNLGEMYVADERFTAHYEAVRPGLAAYVRDAIAANAAAHA